MPHMRDIRAASGGCKVETTGGQMGRSKASGEKVKAERNRAEALKLRMRGETYEAIGKALGKALGVGTTSAHRYIRDGLAELRNLKLETADEYLEMELARLGALEWVLSPLVFGPDPTADPDPDAATDFKPSIAATDTLLRIIDRRCKLLGLYAPAKLEATASIGMAPQQYGVLRVPMMAPADWEKAANS